QVEADTVLQAVGRVRPFTRPREVITFQHGRLPGVRHAAEFNTLEQARLFFDVQGSRQTRREGRAAQAHALRKQGLTRKQIADRLGVSERMVTTYLNPRGEVNP